MSGFLGQEMRLTLSIHRAQGPVTDTDPRISR